MIRTFKEFQQAIQDTLSDIEQARREYEGKANISNKRYNLGVVDGLEKAFNLFQEHFASLEEIPLQPKETKTETIVGELEEEEDLSVDEIWEDNEEEGNN